MITIESMHEINQPASQEASQSASLIAHTLTHKSRRALQQGEDVGGAKLEGHGGAAGGGADRRVCTHTFRRK